MLFHRLFARSLAHGPIVPFALHRGCAVVDAHVARHAGTRHSPHTLMETHAAIVSFAIHVTHALAVAHRARHALCLHGGNAICRGGTRMVAVAKDVVCCGEQHDQPDAPAYGELARRQHRSHQCRLHSTGTAPQGGARQQMKLSRNMFEGIHVIGIDCVTTASNCSQFDYSEKEHLSLAF